MYWLKEKQFSSDVIKHFFNSVKNEDFSTMKNYLQMGMDIDVRDSYEATILMHASFYGYTYMVKFLIDSGAELNLQQKKGWTALMMASQNGHIEVVKLLLDEGADPFLKTENNKTALMIADYTAERTENSDIAQVIQEKMNQIAGITYKLWQKNIMLQILQSNKC